MLNSSRIKQLNNFSAKTSQGPIFYWMSRDQRMKDNWALLFTEELAHKHNQNFGVIFCLQPEFLEAGLRQYDFMLKGLQELEKDLHSKNIPFFLLLGSPEVEIPKFVKDHKVSALVTDFSPLKISRAWKNAVNKKIRIPFYEVDAHNVIPAWVVSPKQEYAAYTIRPKVHKLLSEYLTDFPKIKGNKNFSLKNKPIDWQKIVKNLKVDKQVEPVSWITAGEKAAHKALKKFISTGLKNYDSDRNDPSLEAQSNLSPYLHFGQISAQRIAFEVSALPHSASQEAFLEELIVRRELAENFCYHNPHYDSVKGFPAWATKTLSTHAHDQREYLYSKKQLEEAKTHDELWNAAQMEMVKTGKMHGYMRMYWAKKILEWTKSPDEAMKIAIYLNDKYELDGRDPNGYTGIAWSIGGVHDRPWFNRNVFGQVRYMSASGLKSKFNTKAYLNKIFSNKLF